MRLCLILFRRIGSVLRGDGFGTKDTEESCGPAKKHTIFTFLTSCDCEVSVSRKAIAMGGRKCGIGAKSSVEDVVTKEGAARIQTEQEYLRSEEEPRE
jgi:hypothetical protein